MTALPDQLEHITGIDRHSARMFIAPNLREAFWGYEITPNEQVVDLAVLARFAAVLLTVAAFVAAAGIWLLPAGMFASDAGLSKALISLGLIVLSTGLAQFAGRGTRVRVQIDTANGELREIVRSISGGAVVLSRYGLDAVDSVEVVGSSLHPHSGQVHVAFKCGSIVAVGDGAVTALYPLRDRIMSDCGLDRSRAPRETVWSGPLAA